MVCFMFCGVQLIRPGEYVKVGRSIFRSFSSMAICFTLPYRYQVSRYMCEANDLPHLVLRVGTSLH